MSTWRQAAALSAERIRETLVGWRRARIFYPTMEHQGWDLQRDLPVFSEQIRYDAGFLAWTEANVLQPLAALDPQAAAAPAEILVLTARLARLIVCLRDGRDADALVWDVPRPAPLTAPSAPAALAEAQLDDADRALAHAIRRDPGIYGTQLAEQTHLSESNVHKRLARSGHLHRLGFRQKAGRKGYFPPENPDGP